MEVIQPQPEGSRPNPIDRYLRFIHDAEPRHVLTLHQRLYGEMHKDPTTYSESYWGLTHALRMYPERCLQPERPRQVFGAFMESALVIDALTIMSLLPSLWRVDRPGTLALLEDRIMRPAQAGSAVIIREAAVAWRDILTADMSNLRFLSDRRQ